MSSGELKEVEFAGKKEEQEAMECREVKGRMAKYMNYKKNK